jgi:hypothetical protein
LQSVWRRSKNLPKRALHVLRSKDSSFKWEYPPLSLRSFSSFLRLLSFTSIPHFIFPLITRCRRHFLRKTRPIQLAFRFLISRRIFLCSLTLSNTPSFLTLIYNWSFPSSSSTTFRDFPGVSDLLPEASKFQHQQTKMFINTDRRICYKYLYTLCRPLCSLISVR